MPSTQHESLVELFRQRPSLVADLLTDLGLDVPDYQEAQLESEALTNLSATEYRADVVVVLRSAHKPILAVVGEVQLTRDQDRRWSWPVYLTTLRARLRCPTVLLVVCSANEVAKWCATAIDLGHPGWQLAPVVLGPDLVPVVTDPDQARLHPELAVLSAMTHTGHPAREQIFRPSWPPSRPSNHPEPPTTLTS